jgi:hypothetical protein
LPKKSVVIAKFTHGAVPLNNGSTDNLDPFGTDPDPAFHFDTDPDSDPDPAFQFDTDPDPTV